MTRIYLDMDGTIANLYKGEWLNDIIAEQTRPYDIADRLVDESVLLNLIERGYTIGIISWTAKNGTPEYNARVRRAKREWLANNYPSVRFSEIHIVKYGTPKYRVANISNSILVDDEESNRITWHGIALTPSELAEI